MKGRGTGVAVTVFRKQNKTGRITVLSQDILYSNSSQECAVLAEEEVHNPWNGMASFVFLSLFIVMFGVVFFLMKGGKKIFSPYHVIRWFYFFFQ